MKLSIGKMLFGEVNDECKVVVYGAGKYGEQICDLILRTQRLKLVAIIDREPMNKMLGVGVDVKPVEAIQHLAYDYIIIAINNITILDYVIDDLINNYKVEKEKLVYKALISDEEEELSEYIKMLERNIESQRRIFLFMVPEHGNTGDYAIEIAEKNFFAKFFSEYKVITVTTGEWEQCSERIKNLVKPNDLLFLNGGGYLGDLWGDSPRYMSIVESFPKNYFFMLPNTLSYEDSNYENSDVFMKDMEWFSSKKKLHVFFREKRSFHAFKQYNTRTALFPDMVLSMHYNNRSHLENKRCLLCMRNDREKAIENCSLITDSLRRLGYKYSFFDISLKRFVLQQNSDSLVECICKKLQENDLVITDRLHGMLLSVISDVPCVALDNSTKKISGVYEWLKDRGYAMFLPYNELDMIDEYILRAIDGKKRAGEYIPFSLEYKEMSEYIMKVVNECQEGEA